MEHLPAPTNSIHGEQRTVPYVCWVPYDGGPFLTYPERVGKPQALPAASNTLGQLPYWRYEQHHPKPEDELASFFQTWLFFGLIHEILGDLCALDDFVQLSNSTTDIVVSTSRLVGFIETWVINVANGGRFPTYEHIAECLRLVFVTLRAAGPMFDQRLKMSIVSTGKIFAYAANKAYHIENMLIRMTSKTTLPSIALEVASRAYADATHVLVLDASLQLFDISGTSSVDLCARILACGWMRRLWTLQEGALPAKRRRLWFQFRDRPINIHDLYLQLLRILNDEVCHHGLAVSILKGIMGITTFFSSVPDELGADLATIEAAVEHRSVSVPTDEPLLIGSLLDLNMESIISEPDRTRIHRMWWLMPAARRGIPKDILFRIGPRLKDEGYRWAPSTMLNNDPSNEILQTKRQGANQGIPTSRGLQVSLSGFRVSFPDQSKGLPANPWSIIESMDQLYMRDQDGAWYSVVRRVSRNSGLEDDFLGNEKLCNILKSDNDIRFLYLEPEFQSRVDSDQQAINSLGVKFLYEEEGVIYVQSCMLVHFQRLQITLLEMFETAYQCAELLADSDPARQLAALQEDEVNIELPAYKILFDALGLEIHRIAIMDDNKTALAAARQVSGHDSTVLFEGVIKMLFAGHYAKIGTRTRDSQRWCVD
ncbi:hypothetical protein MMC18_009611 [Xylographa bjoerkii]|nr:hypothetical protein [Xylographa bjoerkii]